MSQIELWGFLPFSFMVYNLALRQILLRTGINKNKTIEGIANINEIELKQSFNVNEEKHLEYLKKLDIDIIISSSGHIFKNKLLRLPKIACINRHSALLPKYGGVLPVFWAMKNKEKKFGVSVHLMAEEIDQGDILSQAEIENKAENSLFYNYMLAFDKSSNSCNEAIKNLLKNRIVKKFHHNKDEYYSFPSSQDIKDFRKIAKAFNFSDIYSFYKTY